MYIETLPHTDKAM